MGQAKRRGTYEERKTLAMAKHEVKSKGQISLPLTEEERASRHKTNLLIAAMLGMAAMTRR